MPAVMPIMGINMTQGMAFMTAFYIGYTLTQIPGGILADRFGPRLVLSGALFVQGLSTLSLGLTESYQAGFLLRVVCGLGAGCVYAAWFKAVVTWFSPTQKGLAIGVVMTAPTLGVTIPNFIMPPLEVAWGWQNAFLGLGLFLIIMAGVFMVLMKDIKTVGGQRKSFLVGLKFVVGNRNILFISLAGFSIVWCQIGFSSIANSYLVDMLAASKIEAGRIMMLYGLIGLLMPTLAGYLCAKLPDRKKTMIITVHIILIFVLILFGKMNTLTTATVAACILGIMIAFANPIYTIIIADNAGPEWAATAGGVGNCIFQFGALLGPLALGAAHDASGHYGWTWWILALGAFMGIIATALVKNKAVT
jgi:sugar phosphate permease